MIRQNRPNPIATHIGHLDRNRQGQRSTHPPSSTTTPFDSDEHDVDIFSPSPDDWMQSVFTKLVHLSDSNHSDATGRFPIVSSQGHQYILVSVFNNYVHMESMASRSADSYVKAYKATFAFFRRLKHHVAVQRIDNETSSQLEDFFRAEDVSVEYAPAQNHRTVRAERAIRDAKNHIISTLATAHPSFPLELWDRLLPQIELTLNHLRPLYPNPDISAYLGVFRTPYDFLAHPIAPCGTLVLVWESPSTRASWAPHGVRGFYLGQKISVTPPSVGCKPPFSFSPHTLHTLLPYTPHTKQCLSPTPKQTTTTDKPHPRQCLFSNSKSQFYIF